MSYAAGRITFEQELIIRGLSMNYSPASMPPPAKVSRLPTCLMVRVEALRAAFCVEGETVKVGAVYTVPHDIARSLAYVGKARLMAWTE